MLEDMNPAQPVRATDIFPDLSEEIDRRIAHSEQRLKYWVLAGIVTNLMVAIFAAVPTIFYIGQISRDINQALQNQQAQTVELAARAKWMQDRMVWEAKVSAALRARGLTPPDASDIP